MRAQFLVATLASLSVAPKALAWGCIGQDCNQAANQISFSAPEAANYDDGKTLTWGPTPGQGWQWASCGTGDEVVDVNSIEVSPDPPVPGQNLTVRAKGTIKDEVSVSTFDNSSRWAIQPADDFTNCPRPSPVIICHS